MGRAEHAFHTRVRPSAAWLGGAVKLVLFSDLHLDAPFAWLGADRAAARTRRQALRDTLRNVTRLAIDARADALLCGGDLYEQARFNQDTRSFLEQTFAELHPLRVYLAPGNHDWYGPESLYRQARWSPNVHVFAADRLTPVPLADGLTLWGLAHRAPAFTADPLDGFGVDRGGVHLALFHGSLRGPIRERDGAPEPHAPFDEAQIARAGLHHAFLGHYHRPRDGDRFTYPGNPDFLTFGDHPDRAAIIATISPDGTVRRERHRVGLTAVHDLTLDVSGCANGQDVRDLLQALLADRTGVARVTVAGELRDGVELRPDDLSSVRHDLDGLLVRLGDVRTAYDVERIAAEPTVRGRFVRDVLAADLAADERRRVLVTGLRALEGRDDLDPL